jgi:penicillin-binding protein 1C
MLFRVAFVGFLFTLALFAWYSKDLPTPEKIRARSIVASTQILDRNGNVLYGIFEDANRIVVDEKDLPDVLKQATVAAEDREFYSHPGIQIKSFIRASLYAVINRSGPRATSTITQQFVKNALLTPQRSIARKIKEIILSLEMEAMFKKEEILTFYLNEIPYGRNAYGAEAASKSYFGKSAKDLTLPEAALLAAMPKAPSFYATHRDELNGRADYVLSAMVDEGMITKEQEEAAKADVQKIAFKPPHDSIIAPHFVFEVRQILEEKYGEKLVNEGGLKVWTTLDLETQKLAEEAVAKGGERNLRVAGAKNDAMVALDPRNGQVLAMVGSRDYFNNDIDGQVNVATSLRQPGSAFKPVVYSELLEGNWGPGSSLFDVKTDFGGGYRPDNYTGQNYGPVSIRFALANSLNVPAVKALALVGVDKAIEQAENFGITSFSDPNRYGLSLVLGGGEVRLVELANAYSTFSNGGFHPDINYIMKVEDRVGKVLEEYKETKPKRVLDPLIAFEIAHILSDNGARGPIFGSRSSLYIPGHTVAAKTGTTDGFRDAWTFAFTPSDSEKPIVVGVWAGNTRGEPMTGSRSAGAMAAAPIMNQFMVNYLKGVPDKEFSQPEGLSRVSVDKITGKLPVEGAENRIDIFASWQIPKDRGDPGKIYKINKIDGLLATDNCPPDTVEEKTFRIIHSEFPNKPNWEAAVRAWAESHGFSDNPPTEFTPLCDSSRGPTATVTSPTNGSTVSGSVTLKASVSGANAVKQVEFQIDDTTLAIDAEAPYETTFNTSLYTTGSHTLSAVAIDQVGFTDKDSISVTFSSVSPTEGDDKKKGPKTGTLGWLALGLIPTAWVGRKPFSRRRSGRS